MSGGGGWCEVVNHKSDVILKYEPSRNQIFTPLTI